MGFYPKHLKVRRYRWNQRIIATAALSGAVIRVWEVPLGDYMEAVPQGVKRYRLGDEDGRHYASRGEAAATYLLWWFDKQGIYWWGDGKR